MKIFCLSLFVAGVLLFFLSATCLSQPVSIKIPLWVTYNNGFTSDTLYFGVASTPVEELVLCDTIRPCFLFCNFRSTDLHQYISASQVDTFCFNLSRSQVSNLFYPQVIHWPPYISLFYDSVILKDNFGFPIDLFKIRMEAVDSFRVTNTGINRCMIITYGPHVTVGLNDHVEQFPTKSILHQNYPNPFNPSTVINYQLSVTNNVALKVYDVFGREVALLVNGRKPAGEYNVEWNASGVPSGVYFSRLQAGERISVNKMLFMK